MSQVMSALQDSEQSRQAMLTPYQNLSNGRNEEHRPQLKLSYMLMLGVLPIFAVASYLGLEAYRANGVRLISEQHPIVSAAAIQADTPIRIQAQSQAQEQGQNAVKTVSALIEEKAEFKLLSYPTYSQLEPTPQLVDIESLDDTSLSSAIVPVADSKSVEPSDEALTKLDRLTAPELTSPPLKENPDAPLSMDQNMGLEELDLSSLSPELALKFQSALQATADSDPFSANEKLFNRETIDIDKTGDQYQGRLPALNLQTHMYSSDRQRRWVKINDHEYSEGDWIENQIQLLKIKPQSVIVEFEDQLLELPALYEWQG
ncbi:general secretion pathway protein GspB [Vibrio cortegadensis]|uniref:general secretion pathway protein GspB n=1 Tax=Vibrio cortegadensis TaxID=1328770 RepID=UPI00352D26D5